jgi:thiol-disulfide isomerase/thioredoxin
MKFAILIAVLASAIAVAGVMYYKPASTKTDVATAKPIRAMPPTTAQSIVPIEKFPASWFYSNRSSRLVGMEGKQAPEIQVKDWLGAETSLSALKGKVVVIDFWATWCRPCMMSIPHNVQMVQQHDPKDFAFIGIHESNRGSDRMAAVAQSSKINYPLAIDRGNSTVGAYGVSFFPTYIVIDRNGIVRGAGLSPSNVAKAVEKLLSEPVG